MGAAALWHLGWFGLIKLWVLCWVLTEVCRAAIVLQVAIGLL